MRSNLTALVVEAAYKSHEVTPLREQAMQNPPPSGSFFPDPILGGPTRTSCSPRLLERTLGAL